MSSADQVDRTCPLGPLFGGHTQPGKAPTMHYVLSLLTVGTGLFLAAAVASFAFTVASNGRVVTASSDAVERVDQVRYASASEACEKEPSSDQCTGPWDTSFGPRT